MQELTFGFMDPARAPRLNAKLFSEWRALAIRSFGKENVCNLQSFAGDSIPDSHRILAKDTGRSMGALRDLFYNSLPQEEAMRFPDIQSFFLYSFTIGVNLFSAIPIELQEVSEPPPIPTKDIFARHYPIRGPDWLCDAVNKEMPSVENVFCDFQNEVLVPTGQQSSVDHRLLADAIAGSFLWAYFGGMFWLREVVEEICQALGIAGGRLVREGPSVFQVKKSMQLIGNDDVERVMAAQRIFKGDE